MMEKSRLGIVFILVGVMLFIISLFFVLPLPNYYLIALFGLLVSVILIAIGFAYSKNDSTMGE